MKKLISTVVTGLCLLLHGHAFADTGDILNFNFTTTYTSSYQGVGITGDADQYWNTLGDPNASRQEINGVIATGDYTIVNSDNSSSDVQISWTSASITKTNKLSMFEGTSYEHLMKQNVYATSSAYSQIELSGLENGTYTVYIYSQGCKTDNENETVALNANGITGSLASTCANTDINNAVIALEDVQVTDGTLLITYISNGGSTNKGIINAFQLEETGGLGALPEPASVILLGVGATLARTIRSRKQFVSA